MITAVAFDIGETLIDETRIWSRWADRLGIPRLTFMGVLGGMAAQGRSHIEVFERFSPEFDLKAELDSWRTADPDGLRENFDIDDLYPDVRPAFARLRAMGKRVMIAGNQPLQGRDALDRMNLGADEILISAELGFEKPSPEFFEKISEVAGSRAEEIMYVGDRLDNDVLPAKLSGMQAVLIRRGPWGYLHADWAEAKEAHAIIDSLLEIPTLVN